MEKTENLERKSKKEWFMALLLGFFIGLAMIIPGVSSATVAIIFGLHSKLLYSFGNIFKSFKKCFLFLLPIGIGLLVGFAFGFFVVQKVFELFPFIIICLFAGLMIGSFPAILDEIKGVKFSATRIVLFIVGVIIPVAIGILSVVFNKTSSNPIQFSIILTFLYLVLGVVISLTQLVPGLSCSAMLMALGQYGSILSTISVSYILKNPLVLLPLASLVIGFAIGIVVCSKGINLLLDKKRDSTYTCIVGLALGSIVSMFINPEVWAVYTSWAVPSKILIDILIGSVLLVIGFILTYLLVRYSRKKKQG